MHDLEYIRHILYFSLCLIGSQCRSASTGVMRSVFLVCVIIRVAIFCKR